MSTLLSMSPLSSKVRERELADNIQLAQLLSEKMVRAVIRVRVHRVGCPALHPSHCPLRKFLESAALQRATQFA